MVILRTLKSILRNYKNPSVHTQRNERYPYIIYIRVYNIILGIIKGNGWTAKICMNKFAKSLFKVSNGPILKKKFCFRLKE